MKLRLSATVRILSVPVAAIAVLFLSACSNGAFQQAGSTLPTATVPAAPINLGHSDGVHRDAISANELFVGEFGFRANYVAIYQNGTFKKIGKIKLGINHPYGAWVDSYGLYIANDFAPSITEYSSPKSVPFTYNAGMSSPVAVTTDPLGNVFEGDIGYVNEYQQKINFVSTKCSVGGFVMGIANDGPNVFVAYMASPVLYIFEFTDFSGCKGHLLGVRLKGAPDSAAGMAIDKNHNIIIGEAGNQTVDIIKPPYKAVSSYLAVLNYPTDVTINSANDRVWITNPGGVFDVYYPSGKLVGSILGPDAVSAVDGSNYVH
jgi:hypothetical protein